MPFLRNFVASALRDAFKESGLEQRLVALEEEVYRPTGARLLAGAGVVARAAGQLFDSKWVRLGVGVGVLSIGYGAYRLRREPVCSPKRLSDNDGLIIPGAGAPEAIVEVTAPFYNAAPPLCQIVVLRRDGDSFTDVGNGIRMPAIGAEGKDKDQKKHLFVVPEHVISAAARDGLVYLASAASFQAGSIKYISVNVSQFEQPEGVVDLVYCVIASDKFSNLGVKCAKLGPIRSGTEVRACITDASGAKSVGAVYATDLLTLEYTGNTRNGFSGAPYMVGTTVVGIHMCGYGGANPHNEGFPILAIAALLEPIKYMEEARGGAGYPREVREYNPRNDDFQVFDNDVLFKNAQGKYRYYRQVPLGLIEEILERRDLYRQEEDWLPSKWDKDAAEKAKAELEARPEDEVLKQLDAVRALIGNQGEVKGRLQAHASSLPSSSLQFPALPSSIKTRGTAPERRSKSNPSALKWHGSPRLLQASRRTSWKDSLPLLCQRWM
jgi:hypothetical protein